MAVIWLNSGFTSVPLLCKVKLLCTFEACFFVYNQYYWFFSYNLKKIIFLKKEQFFQLIKQMSLLMGFCMLSLSAMWLFTPTLQD